MRTSCSILTLRLMTMGLSGASTLTVGVQPAARPAIRQADRIRVAAGWRCCTAGAPLLQLFQPFFDGGGQVVARQPLAQDFVQLTRKRQVKLHRITVVEAG